MTYAQACGDESYDQNDQDSHSNGSNAAGETSEEDFDESADEKTVELEHDVSSSEGVALDEDKCVSGEDIEIVSYPEDIVRLPFQERVAAARNYEKCLARGPGPWKERYI